MRGRFCHVPELDGRWLQIASTKCGSGSSRTNDVNKPKPIPKRAALPSGDLMEDADPMEGRCTARSKQTAQRCKRPAILGGRVCYIHGGAAPQVRRAARERLAMLVDPAITRLGELIAQTDFPSTAYAAAKDVLDRTGFKPTDKV